MADRPGGEASMDFGRSYPTSAHVGRVPFRSIDGRRVWLDKKTDRLLNRPAVIRVKAAAASEGKP